METSHINRVFLQYRSIHNQFIICGLLVLSGIILGWCSTNLLFLLFLLALGTVFFIVWVPEVALWIIVFSSIVVPQFVGVPFSIGPFHVYIVEILILLIILSVIKLELIKFNSIKIGMPLLLSIGIFLIISFFALFNGLMQHGIQRAFSDFRRLFPIAFCFLIPNSIKTLAQVKRLITVFQVSGFCVMAYIIFAFSMGHGAWHQTAGYTFIGSSQAMFLMFPILFLLAAFSTRKDMQFKRVSILILISVVEFTIVIASFSRAVWLGFLLGTFLIMYFAGNKAKVLRTFLWIMGSASVLGTFLFFSIAGFPLVKTIAVRAGSIVNFAHYLEDRNISIRLEMWRQAIDMIRQHPIGGWGYGVPWGFYTKTLWGEIASLKMHNTYLNMMLKTGIVGLCSMIGLTIYFLRKGARMLWTSENQELKVYLLGVMSCYVAFLVVSLTGTTLGQFYLYPFLWIFPGIIIAIVNIDRRLNVQAGKETVF